MATAGTWSSSELRIVHRRHGGALSDPVWMDGQSVYVLSLLAAGPLILLASRLLPDVRILGWGAAFAAAVGVVTIALTQIRRWMQRKQCERLFAGGDFTSARPARIVCEGMSLPLYGMVFSGARINVPGRAVVFIDARLLNILVPLLLASLVVSGLATGSFRSAAQAPWLLPLVFVVCWAPYFSAAAHRRDYVLEGTRLRVACWWLGFRPEREERVIDLTQCRIHCSIPRDCIELTDRLGTIRIRFSSLVRPHGFLAALVSASGRKQGESSGGPCGVDRMPTRTA